jgi:enamine deaminase RidA (YjgF/YER057c/UK114 family)
VQNPQASLADFQSNAAQWSPEKQLTAADALLSGYPALDPDVAMEILSTGYPAQQQLKGAVTNLEKALEGAAPHASSAVWDDFLTRLTPEQRSSANVKSTIEKRAMQLTLIQVLER